MNGNSVFVDEVGGREIARMEPSIQQIRKIKETERTPTSNTITHPTFRGTERSLVSGPMSLGFTSLMPS
jgi:hypothetical protein